MHTIPVSPIDFLFSNGSYPIEFLFFFRNRCSYSALLTSLSALRSNFFPFFSSYQAGIISENDFPLTNYIGEFQINEDFDVTCSPDEIFDRFKGIAEPEKNSLFYLRVLQLRNGTVLIPHLKHIAGDGYSYFYFLMELAARTRGDSVHTDIRNTYNRRLTEVTLNPSALQPSEIPEKSTNIKIIRHSKQSVKDNIRKIALDTGVTVSSNDYLSATLIKRMVSDNDYAGEKFSVTMPVDVRNIVKEYGRYFIGNGLFFHKATFNAEYLRNSGEAEIAIEIRKSMPDISTESYRKYQTELLHKINERKVHELPVYNPAEGCLITNLSQLPSAKLDFGTGTPDLIFPMTVAVNSAIILSDNTDYLLRISV